MHRIDQYMAQRTFKCRAAFVTFNLETERMHCQSHCPSGAINGLLCILLLWLLCI